MHWLAGSSIRVMTQQVASTELKFYRVVAAASQESGNFDTVLLRTKHTYSHGESCVQRSLHSVVKYNLKIASSSNALF